jgi:sugar phosphate isomerase/epimerase
MKTGLIVSLTGTPGPAFEKLTALGFSTCQLNCWEQARFTPQTAAEVKAEAARTGIEISAVWCGWEGPAVWNFLQGPLTLGIVPAQYRAQRLAMLMRGAEFTAWLGVRDMVTHVGFIPEDPNLAQYSEVIAALKQIAGRCRELGLRFLFETGQETPVTILRAIEDIGLDNVGVNLDPANLILYGKANPIDALDVFGSYVWGVHAKDGFYPTSGRALGREVALGEGKVDICRLVARLKELGYSGALTIEREIEGEEQIRDILRAKALLEQLIAG